MLAFDRVIEKAEQKTWLPHGRHISQHLRCKKECLTPLQLWSLPALSYSFVR